MDAKEHLLAGDLYRRIRAHTFHERDVLAFLILLRPYSVAGSPVRELSNFVAHREKDRGSLKTYVHYVLTYGEAVVAKDRQEATPRKACRRPAGDLRGKTRGVQSRRCSGVFMWPIKDEIE
jgi:hypothetical protein